jgi:periplasmic glucans biosynthesis protein
MHRRELLTATLAGLLGAGTMRVAGVRGQEAAGFGFEDVVEIAREAAARPFEDQRMRLVEPFAELDYDRYRAIRVREASRIWPEHPAFRADPLPPGSGFRDALAVSLVDSGGTAVPVAFSSDLFHFDPEQFPYPDGRAPGDLARDMAFTGVRLRHPINAPGVWDEFLVFQGASYFRAIARGMIFGLSARGLAIGTAGPDPEEFPRFTRLWLHEPAPGATAVTVQALLDSPSLAGAYEFVTAPGADTLMDVRAVLFPRRDIGAAGIAPLTSMYFFGPESRAGINDFRDAVHDSCGLEMINGEGDRLWRPLSNPPSLQISAFQDDGPRAFGLSQRFRDFAHYQDAEARYELRPSAWIEPGEDWGPGSVVLVEIPTRDEFADNIVAFWRPERPLVAGTSHAVSYRLSWGALPPRDAPVARVTATRGGLSIRDPAERVFVVDFDLGRLEIDRLSPQLRVSAGEVKGPVGLAPLPVVGNHARVGFHFLPGDAVSSEFRLVLDGPSGPASEIWLYRWTAA